MKFVWILIFGSWIFNAGPASGEEGAPGGADNPFIRAGADDPAAEAKHLSSLRRLTYAGEKNGEGYFSADGKRIVFQGVREPELKNPFYQIYTMDLATGAVRRVSPGAGRTTCSYFHPQKQRILFASSHLDPDAAKHQAEEIEKLKTNPPKRYAWDFDPKLDIFETDFDGKNAKRLTDAEGYDAECAYSPDGSRVVFCSFRDGDGEIYVMDAEGKNQTRLTNTKGYDGGPFFSPDGKKIVWRRFTLDEKNAEVWTMDADGKNQTQVTTIGAMAWAPYWHPSMKWIVFACNHEDPAFEVYAVRPDGKNLTRLTYNSGFDGLPVFSPDGTKLMWTSTRDHDGSHLYMASISLPGIEAKQAPAPKAHEGIKAKDLEARVKELKEAKDIVAYLCKAFKEIGLKPKNEAEGEERALEFRDEKKRYLVRGILPVNGKQGENQGQGESRKSIDLIVNMRDAETKTWSRERMAGVLELLRQMNGVLKFRGLEIQIAVAIGYDDGMESLSDSLEEHKKFFEFAAGLMAKKGGAWTILVEDIGRVGECEVLDAYLGGDNWRSLVEDLSASNPSHRIFLTDERNRNEASLQRNEDLKGYLEFSKMAHTPVLIVGEAVGKKEKSEADDVAKEINYEALAAKANLALGAVYRLATGDAKVTYSVYDRAAANARKRPYLGTRPEYKGDGSGVVLQSVYPNSPAETAGVKAGDKVVAFAGKKVSDAESFLAALEACAPGAETEIEVVRGGETLKLKIKPDAR